MKRSRTFRIALGGICLALTLVFLLGGSFVPGIDLTLFALSSVFTAIMIIETGVTGGALLFVAAVILGVLLLPNKLAILPYAGFFGYYGIVKYAIEKLKKPQLQIACKCAFFALVLCVGVLGLRQLLAASISLPDYPAGLLILAGVIFLLLYDCILSWIINHYYRRVKGTDEGQMKLS